MKTRHFFAVLTLIFVLLFTGCATLGGNGSTEPSSDIVILYTSDVHCGIEDNIGFAGLASYKKHMEEMTPYVTLVDGGDNLQGGIMAVISSGEYIIDIMNRMGYDMTVLGNHEFNVGIKHLTELIDSRADFQYLSCNITYTGSQADPLKNVKPYIIKEYGKTKVAFIGVSTPDSMVTSSPYHFQENGEIVYDLAGGDDGMRLAEVVQANIDECYSLGADYVILVTHLGYMMLEPEYTSKTLISRISGCDAVLDGHAHMLIPCAMTADKTGKLVPVTSVGTKMQGIGQLVITSDGHIYSGMISDYEDKDKDIESFIAEVKSRFNDQISEIVATASDSISISDSEGKRLVRKAETGIGNLVADAYRAVICAEIGLVNGGGLRKSLPAGNITLGNIIDVTPFGNTVSLAEVSGQHILDFLEMSYRLVDRAGTENGGFMHVSGLRFTIDSSISSTVKLDDLGCFQTVAGERKVKNVEVLDKNGQYVPLDPDRNYTVATTDYILKKGGDGNVLLIDDKILFDLSQADYMVLAEYIRDVLHGDLSRYYHTEGRIRVK
ncbi:MAG: bifunctional metallophosphatase/5'-nucleotidase [Spirochaetia bacterium]|nr:bifunctional metallophosphatase/5'-nucleotidase [Spirochaetia bacterium]